MRDAIYEALELLRLPENWDSYGGSAIKASAVADAVTFLWEFHGLQKPCVVPCSGGGVQLEWHLAGYDLEIEFMGEGKLEIYAEAGNEELVEWLRWPEDIGKFYPFVKPAMKQEEPPVDGALPLYTDGTPSREWPEVGA